MGYDVSVVYLTTELRSSGYPDHQKQDVEITYPELSFENILEHRDNGTDILDIRSSKAFSQGHLVGSVCPDLRDRQSIDRPACYN